MICGATRAQKTDSTLVMLIDMLPCPRSSLQGRFAKMTLAWRPPSGSPTSSGKKRRSNTGGASVSSVTTKPGDDVAPDGTGGGGGGDGDNATTAWDHTAHGSQLTVDAPVAWTPGGEGWAVGLSVELKEKTTLGSKLVGAGDKELGAVLTGLASDGTWCLCGELWSGQCICLREGGRPWVCLTVFAD